MSDKFDLYDLLGILVPGVLLLCLIPIVFPTTPLLVAPFNFPDAFKVVGLTAASVFIGHLVQALASFCEPLLYKTWGGRPSERALEKGLGERYLPADMGARIRTKLAAELGASASTRSMFLFAMQRAEASKSRRVPIFNGLYAYHRVLVVLTSIAMLIYVGSFWHGLASTLTWKQNVGCIVLLLLLLALLWNRARQRGYYYVREVLLSAEQSLTSPAAPSLKDKE